MAWHNKNIVKSIQTIRFKIRKDGTPFLSVFLDCRLPLCSTKPLVTNENTQKVAKSEVSYFRILDMMVGMDFSTPTNGRHLGEALNKSKAMKVLRIRSLQIEIRDNRIGVNQTRTPILLCLIFI